MQVTLLWDKLLLIYKVFIYINFIYILFIICSLRDSADAKFHI